MMSASDAFGYLFFMLFTVAMVGFLIAMKAAKNPTIKGAGAKVGGMAVKSGGNWAIRLIVGAFKK